MSYQNSYLLMQAQKGGADSDTEQEVGESHDQYMMRRTKEFNIAVRMRPYELQLWLDYADFQDDLHRSATSLMMMFC